MYLVGPTKAQNTSARKYSTSAEVLTRHPPSASQKPHVPSLSVNMMKTEVEYSPAAQYSLTVPRDIAQIIS